MNRLSHLPIAILAEYDAAARWCACHGLTDTTFDHLPTFTDPAGVLKWIYADPEAFAKRIHYFVTQSAARN